MALVLHATPHEGTDRGPSDAPIDPDEGLAALTRVISYDPFRDPEEEPPHRLHDAAYKVSVGKRIAQVTVGVIVCWLASGIIFGFAALKPVLIAEGVYSDLCPDGGDRERACVEQDIRLNVFFTAASVTTNISALPIGAILDRFGRRVLYLAGSLLLAAGSVLMGLSFVTPEFEGYIFANILLALGGTAIFVPSYQLANAFPKYSGAIVALVTGSFDASAAVFLFYRLAYDATGQAFRPAHFFFGYAAVPLAVILLEFLVMPAHDYHTVPELQKKIDTAQDPAQVDSDDEDLADELAIRGRRGPSAAERARFRRRRASQIDELLGGAAGRTEKAEHERERRVNSAVWGALHGRPVAAQMRTPWFVLILLLTVLQMLRMNYFIATIDSQYAYLVGEAWEPRISAFFNVALPVCGVAATPFIAVLLDRFSVAAVLGVIVVMITATGVFNCLPFVWAGYVTVLLFVIVRPLYYSAMSDYATKVFGFATFGRIYGTIICGSGMVNFLQSGLDALTLDTLHGDPVPVNITLTVGGAFVGVALTAYVAVQGRRFRRRQIEEGISSERQSLLPIDEDSVSYTWT